MERTARILVVDEDPWIQRRAATALGQRGYQVNLAGDVQGALAVASTVRPDVVVTSLSMPEIEGYAWWERMRRSSSAAGTPIIFLTVHDTAQNVRGRTPRDQVLRKPFRVEELERAVVTAIGSESLESNTRPPPPAPPPPRPHRSVDPTKPSAGFRPLSAMRGEIDQISLASILTILEMERKTGLLLVEGAQGVARLYLHRGRIVRAQIEDASFTGAGAVYAVLAWSQGAFDFLAGDVGGVDDIQTSTTFLLIEGARRLDEARREEAEAKAPVGAKASPPASQPASPPTAQPAAQSAPDRKL